MISFFCVKFSYKKSDAISLFSIQRSYSSSEIFCANGSVNCNEKGDEVDKNTRKKYRGLKIPEIFIQGIKRNKFISSFKGATVYSKQMALTGKYR